jgi:Spy/CpxP family protein refolding chaperone
MPLIVERRREVERARQDFHDACRSAAADPDSLRRLVKRLTLAQGRLDSLVTESLLRELETLTPEQRDRYLEAMPWSAHGRGRFPSPDRGQARHRGADPHR